MLRILVLLLLPTCMAAADWLEFRSGPFTVLTDVGEKEGRTVLNSLEQLRYALGSQLGQPDLPSVWPIDVIVRRKAEGSPVPQFSRKGWIATITALEPATVQGVVKILLDSWTGMVPPPIERGLLQLYSTLDVDGTRVTLGVPPPQKDRDWSRVHMLAVHPNYSGKLRVLLYNLGKGVDRDLAYRNAFEMGPQQIEAALNAYIEANTYGTIPLSGRPLNARKELIAKKVLPGAAELALADARMLESEYAAILGANPASVEAKEGLGLLAARAGQTEKARGYLKDAIGARPLVEYAGLLTSPMEKRTALVKAIAVNKLWAEPHRHLAAVETDPARRAAELKLAAALEPRHAPTWIALAETEERLGQFPAAAKSWAAADRATDDLTERERIRQRRAATDQRRVEQQIAERDEARRKTEQEIQDLKNRSLSSIREAEARANAGKSVIDASTLPVYKELLPSIVSGTLQRVDCGKDGTAKLHVLSGRKTWKFQVSDAARVVIKGGERALGCGPQKPVRTVVVNYTPNTWPGVAGEVASLEFP